MARQRLGRDVQTGLDPAGAFCDTSQPNSSSFVESRPTVLPRAGAGPGYGVLIMRLVSVSCSLWALLAVAVLLACPNGAQAGDPWYPGKLLAPRAADDGQDLSSPDPFRSPAFSPDGAEIVDVAKKKGGILSGMASGTKRMWNKTTGIFRSKKETKTIHRASSGAGSRASNLSTTRKKEGTSQYDPSLEGDRGNPKTVSDWMSQPRPGMSGE